MTDNLELIRRAQAGDRDADTMLVERNNGLIWSIVRRYLGRGVEQDAVFDLCRAQNRGGNPALPAR